MPNTEKKTFLTSSLNNAKLIISTLMVLISLVVGGWTTVTTVFIPRAEAEIVLKKLDLESSYNKAFRLEQRLERIDRIATIRTLSKEELASKKRYEKQLIDVDKHIDKLENKMYGDK